MIAQRPAHAAPVRRGVAESLPLADGEIDAALAVLTTHHWSDLPRALREILRVARRRAVIFTCDPKFTGFWLYREYQAVPAAELRAGTALSAAMNGSRARGSQCSDSKARFSSSGSPPTG